MKLKLRPVRQDDCELLFHWANDPEVRANSFSQGLIEKKDHERWFEHKLAEGIPWFILMNEESNAGVIRFDLSEGKYKTNFLITKDFRGKGLGKEIIKLGLEELERYNSNVSLVFGLVKNDNVTSIRSFLANQFSQLVVDTATLLFERQIKF
jgi:UDP-2,4-diacetamido-2,4,6-trideoxy-beta-L-altropyranose hydrolase